jgi:RNase P subunit RPR2
MSDNVARAKNVYSVTCKFCGNILHYEWAEEGGRIFIECANCHARGRVAYTKRGKLV